VVKSAQLKAGGGKGFRDKRLPVGVVSKLERKGNTMGGGKPIVHLWVGTTIYSS